MQKLSDGVEGTPAVQREAGQEELASRGGWPSTEVTHEGPRHVSSSSLAGSHHLSGLSAQPSPPPRRPLELPSTFQPRLGESPLPWTPSPCASLHQNTFQPTSHRSCLVTHRLESVM